MPVPEIPVELLAQIISAAWHMRLSPQELITLIQSSALVNSTWADTFDLISSRDVYIPSAAFCDDFIRRLRTPPPALVHPEPLTTRFRNLFLGRPAKSSPRRRSANNSCQSITIQIPNLDVHPPHNRPMRLPMGSVLDDLLEQLDVHSLAPNLRRLSIEYVDAGFDDVFGRVGLAALPEQVTHLDVSYVYSSTMPPWLAGALQDKQARRKQFKWRAESVMRLSVFGASEKTVADLVLCCPNVRDVERL
ncbi:hypothetical protein R3P38DRAFT_1361524 [Favolaschia claudopus]|uniref:F-box domain-containing protein n=1 Tax=Favolaschia claudopus TaxID=2862362 RepID=A0AAW0DXI1_9AGAR